jgi:hypothetical protein
MNREQIIQMAREAGLDPDLWNYTDAFEHFAKLVAEHERTECLKFCDQVAEYFPSSGFVGSFIGSKIRDRG